MTTLSDKVAAINAVLRAGEPGNISYDAHADVAAYGPQATFDAVNSELAGEWGYAVSEPRGTGPDEKIVLVTVSLALRLADGTWRVLGSSAGGSRNERGNYPDAIKAATSDGLKKVLAVVLGVGSRAYRGELSAPTKPAPAPAPADEQVIRDLLESGSLEEGAFQQIRKGLHFDRSTATPEAWAVLRQACLAATKGAE